MVGGIASGNLPTSVGMYRTAGDGCAYRVQSPHKRGDVPLVYLRVSVVELISPQAWGCTAAHKTDVADRDNLPTSVGMYRTGGNMTATRY